MVVVVVVVVVVEADLALDSLRKARISVVCAFRGNVFVYGIRSSEEEWSAKYSVCRVQIQCWEDNALTRMRYN